MIAALTTSMVLAVAPGATATTTQKVPEVESIAITVAGQNAEYERVTPCRAYAYGAGVVARIDACGKRWKLTVWNHGTRRRTVRVEVM